MGVGLVGSRFLTSINNLEITGSGTGAFITETNGVVLQGVDIGAANEFDLRTLLGSVTDGAGTTVNAGTLTVNAADNIGLLLARLDTTATVFNLSLGGNGFVETSNAAQLDTGDVTLVGDGLGGQKVVITGDSLAFNTGNISSFSTNFIGGDSVGFAVAGDITMQFNPFNGNNRGLQLVAGNDILFGPGDITLTLGNTTGTLGLGGNISTSAAADTFLVTSTRVDIVSDTTLATNKLHLNVPLGGVRAEGGDLTIVPVIAGADITLGNGLGNNLLSAQSLNAITGFDGVLNIGGVVDPQVVGGAISPGIAGDVSVTRPLPLVLRVF